MGQLTTETVDAPQALVEELLDVGLLITDLLALLLEDAPVMATPEDGEVLIEVVINTCRPALSTVAADDCLVAVTLIRAIRDQILDALRGGRASS